MVEILGEVFQLSLFQTPLSIGDAFGTIEGYKISADLIAPVGGMILQINSWLLVPAGQGGQIDPIVNDPYNSGWFIVVQLNNPNDLKSLLTPQGYANFIASAH